MVAHIIVHSVNNYLKICYIIRICYKDVLKGCISMAFDKIDKRILTYLIEEDWPVTTEMVAKELAISWNTAQLHLYKLLSEGLVKGKKVGRQNQWMITDKGKDASK
jgi:predicted transcriptional regulator